MIARLGSLATTALLALSASAQTTTSAAAASTSSAASSTTVSSSQYWHERYHGLLSMAAYGDYETLCPLVFTEAALLKSFPNSTLEPWTVLDKWGPTASGLSGFAVQIPEMDKVVMVFGGLYIADWESLNSSSTNLKDIFYLDCDNCTAHAGAVEAYVEARTATNNWATVAAAVNATGAQWSITGHGFGGMVAQVAALDLGWAGKSHWVHSHGAPRVMNAASANLYNALYAGEASQRTVANDDSLPTIIPASDDYEFTLQGFHVYGTNATYGQNYDICNTADDVNCLGGGNLTDSYFYYTPIGTCGAQYSANATQADAVESSLSSAYYETATASHSVTLSGALPNVTSATSATASSAVATSSAVTTAASSAAAVSSATGVVGSAAASAVTGSAAAATSPASSGAQRVALTGAALGLVGLAFGLLV